MANSTVNRLIALFDQAFRGLSCHVSMAESERLGILVHRAMQSKTRTYHSAGHVFAICEGMNPQQTLAGLFHDLVYYQLDGGFPMHVRHLLQDVTQTVGGELVLQPFGPDDTALGLCTAIFDFNPGQVLPLYGGMNEFLSAVVAARLLQTHLDSADLIAVLACIEATIPFRKPDAQGLSPCDKLAARVHLQLRRLFDTLDVQALAERVTTVVWDAVAVTNRDVGSFAEADRGLFLSNTWLLIEESNAPLTVAGMYTVNEYRCSLTRMDGFLRSLDATHIFHQHKGYPTAQAVTDLRVVAERNIRFACDFLGAKIVSISIVEALARCTGTDAPVSMFLGDIRSTFGRPDRVEDFLPAPHAQDDMDADLLRVFEKGRTLESSSDLTVSPITAFVYHTMGHQGTRQALDHAREMFDGPLSPLAFLQRLNADMVRSIILACSRISLSRRDTLLALEKTLQDLHEPLSG